MYINLVWRWVGLRDGAQTYQHKFVFIFQLSFKLRLYIHIYFEIWIMKIEYENQLYHMGENHPVWERAWLN